MLYLKLVNAKKIKFYFLTESLCIVLFDKTGRKSFQFQRIPYFKGEFSQNIDEAKFREIGISEIQGLYKLYGNKENNWILLNTEQDLKILSKILTKKTAVRDIAYKFMQGIATSCDDLYFAEIIRENPDSFDLKFNYPSGSETVITGMEKRYFKRLLKGRDVHRYEELNSNTCVFFPYSIDRSEHPCKAELAEIEELKRYPKTYEYVVRFKSDFENREKGSLKGAPDFYKYVYPKNLCDFEQEKLMSMEICACGEANFAIDRNGFYCTSTVYSLVKTTDCKYSYECLLGILNSSLFWWFLRHTGDVLAENTIRVKTNYVYPFRLPDWSQNFDDTVSSLVRQRIRGNKDAERQIDLLITEAYGLSRDEACIVCPKLKSCCSDAENLLASANKS